MERSRVEHDGCAPLSRRRFSAGLCLSFVTVLAGCGGSLDGNEASGADWEVAPNRALTLTRGATFNIAATLPPDVPAGGVFDVDPAGAPLPSGITLSRTGMLTVGRTAVGSAAGVMFRYTPPA